MNNAAKKATKDYSFADASEPTKNENKKNDNLTFGIFPNAMDMCSQLLANTMEFHNETVRIANDYYGGTVRTLCAISSDLTDSSNRSFTQIIGYSQETAQCRTINAVVDLQQKATQQAIENCVDATRKVTGQLQGHVNKSLSLFQDHTANVSERISKVAKKNK